MRRRDGAQGILSGRRVSPFVIARSPRIISGSFIVLRDNNRNSILFSIGFVYPIDQF